MRFRLLGPLRVVDEDQPVPLGGTNQRAALGYLLLYPNQVVATSRLLHALWRDDAPPTARKILQNAISNLRRALGRSPDDTSVMLVTRAPGYLLSVNSEAVDACRFRDLAESGRTALAARRWEAADRDLRAALALWHGPALADLAELGFTWPELTALQNAKLAALEDMMEVALQTGRYLEVVTELEPLVTSTPLRERLCRQLMLAMYHSGRQADALSVYRRIRSVLVGRLGLDPSPELRELERAILDHDPGLARTTATAPVPAIPSMRLPDTVPDVGDGTDVEPVDVAEAGTDEQLAVAAPPLREALERPEPDLLPAPHAGERRRVTAVLVRADVPRPAAAEVLEHMLAGVGAAVSERIGRFGGCGHQTMGPVMLATFGADRTREDDARRAIKAAMEIARFGSHGVRLRVAVATGEVLVVRNHQAFAGAAGHQVTGHLFGAGLDLLHDAEPGVVRVCENTRYVCQERFAFTPTGTAAGGFDVAELPRLELTSRINLPFTQRSRERDHLAWWLDDVRRRRRPHRVTVLAPTGIGKSRLMHEFRRHVTETMKVRCLVGCNQGFGPDTPYASLAGVVRSYAGITGGDSVAERNRKFDAALAGLGGPEATSAMLADNLRDLIARPADQCGERVDYRAAFRAWRWFVEELASSEPLVVVLEDLDLVDDVLLTFIGDLVEKAGELPLLLVVTARPELGNRPAYWAGGNRSATTMTLEPLPRDAIETLLDSVLPDDTKSELRASLADKADGNPLYAIEYARAVTTPADDGGQPVGGAGEAGDEVPVPPVVHNIISARLDTLSDAGKCVLHDAALLGGSFSGAALAALSDRDDWEIQECLQSLARQELLRRTRLGPELGDIQYAFVHQLIGEVARSRLPHHVRAGKHRLVAQWLRTRSDESPQAMVHQYRQAVLHTVRAGLSAEDVAKEAFENLMEVAERAAARGRMTVVRHCHRAALEFCPTDHPDREQLLRWRELKATS